MKTETDHLKINWTDSINCAEGSWVPQHVQSDVSIAQSSEWGQKFCSNGLFTRLSTSHRSPKLKAKCDSSSLPPLLSHETEELSVHLSLNHQFLGNGGPHQAACGGKVFGWGGASGEPMLWVSLFEKGAHKQCGFMDGSLSVRGSLSFVTTEQHFQVGTWLISLYHPQK